MMNRFWKRLTALVLCLLLCAASALGEDCFTIDVDTLDLDRLNSDDYVGMALSASTQGVRVRKYISHSSEVASTVRLTLTRMDTRALLFDKNYGYQSGTFDSGVIYLPYGSGSTVPYLITLYVGDYVYGLPFMQLQRRMESNGASTAGVRLCDLDPAQSSDWLMGTMVDLNDLRAGGSRTVQICASNSCVIGSAVISVRGNELSVQLCFAPEADVELEDASLYVVTDGQVLSGTRGHAADARVDVSGAEKALVYVPMQVSYDPAGLPAFRYDQGEAVRQQQLWSEAHASRDWIDTETSDVSEENGWADEWSSGWEDGWSDGWSDGWGEG